MRVLVSRFRWTLWLGGALAAVVALLYGASYYNYALTCHQRETVFLSPDGAHKARLVDELCESFPASGDAFWVAVSSKDSSFRRETQVSLTWNFAPDVAWSDDRHLVITIQQVVEIKTSLHQADGITVIYRLADRLSEENFRKDTDENERRWEELLRTRTATVTGNPDKDPAALKEQIARTWKDYRRFKEWARANAENVGS